MQRSQQLRAIGLVLILSLTVSAYTCNSQTKNLATASDAIAHALANAQQAAKQGVNDGIVTFAEEKDFEEYVVKASQAGLVLDQAIRANQSATNVSQQLNVFLDAFAKLNTAGVTGIKNPRMKITLATILNGAQASVAIIAAAVGGK